MNYLIASIRERILIKYHLKNLGWKLERYSKIDTYDEWDIIYKDENGQLCVGEIKVRDKYSNDYMEQGWILESQKYDKLIKLHNNRKKDFNLNYINIFNDCIVVWNLNNIDTQVEDRLCIKSTVYAGNGKKIKKIIYLHKADGVIYNVKSNIQYFETKSIKIYNRFFKQAKNK